MAYKTFANGFPLPASDLNNFLMNQSVIVFADSAARTIAIPTPVEGMLTYLEDTNAYESWNGSAFVNINDNTDAIPKSTVTTAQDLIVADGASSVTRLGVGTDDQVLSVVAGAVAWADAGGGGGFTSYEVLTASQTWTVPTGISRVSVYLAGGGGGGGSGSIVATTNNPYVVGAAGGAGSSLAYLPDYEVTAGVGIVVTVGAGGAGGASRVGTNGFGLNGGDGSVSSFDGKESGFGRGGLAGRSGNGTTVAGAVTSLAGTFLQTLGLSGGGGSNFTGGSLSNPRIFDSLYAGTAGNNGGASSNNVGLAGSSTGSGTLAGGAGGAGCGRSAGDTGNGGNAVFGGGAGGGAENTGGNATGGDGGAGGINSGSGGGGGGGVGIVSSSATGLTSGAGGSGGAGFVIVVY